MTPPPPFNDPKKFAIPPECEPSKTAPAKASETQPWRIGVVAPGCTPSFAVSPNAVPDSEVASVAAAWEKSLSEDCFVFAFRSWGDWADDGCARLVSLFAVHGGRREFTADDVADVFRSPIVEARDDARRQALVSMELRGLLEVAKRRIFVAFALGAIAGAAVAIAAWLAPRLSEHASFRATDDHADNERPYQAEDVPDGDACFVDKACFLPSVAFGFVGGPAGDCERDPRHLVSVGVECGGGLDPSAVLHLDDLPVEPDIRPNLRSVVRERFEDLELIVRHSGQV
jgi:hypothetical protein